MSIDNPAAPLRAVCVFDPAIDFELTPLRIYGETRAAELVAIVPGAHARWTTLRPLSVAEFMTADSMPSAPAKLLGAFRLACTEVENFTAPGESLFPTKSHRSPDGSERKVWSDADLQRLADAPGLGLAFIYEMGGVAYERALQGNALSGSVYFTLPPSSELVLMRIERLHAARTQKTDGTRSNEGSARS